jgi:pyruvate formate-lyase activating enzyme-like uncharacterized protein
LFSSELRELEKQLKEAYMNKARSAQLAEKEAQKYDCMVKDEELDRLAAEQRMKAEELAKQQEIERLLTNQSYQEALQRQLQVCGVECGPLEWYINQWITQFDFDLLSAISGLCKV